MVSSHFFSLGERIAIWAVSPNEDVVWPADEAYFVDSKLIGLQIKKPSYNASKSNNFNRLSWTFHNRKGQLNLVKKFPEIYYCLPIFLNRNIKDEALNHCLFWKPEHNDMNACYSNSKASTPHNDIKNAHRWGLFIEDVLQCNAGRKLTGKSDAVNFSETVRVFLREYEDSKESEGIGYHLFFVLIPISN